MSILIVGQGLAGSLLGYFLIQRSQQVTIIDQGLDQGSSIVAAGLINPITGRRLVPSWRYYEFNQFCKEFYPSVESVLDIDVFQETEIYRIINDQADMNLWYSRVDEPIEVLHQNSSRQNTVLESFDRPFGWGIIRKAAILNTRLLLKSLRAWFRRSGSFIQSKFEHDNLKQLDSGKWMYGGIEYDIIVFCEGFGLYKNPYFDYIPFDWAKGEALIIKSPQLTGRNPIKHRLMFIPFDEGSFWVGSNYEWEFDDVKPTESTRNHLISVLDTIFLGEYQIVDQLAGVRAPAKDRRPVLGEHPQYDGLMIYNGLGTKGSSQAPLLAKEMCDRIVDGSALSDEVSVDRFNRFLD